MLELQDVSVSYGRVAALQSLSIEVKQGEFVGLVGHNGAGKSTTLLTIAGALRPVSGDILLEGRSIVGLSPDEILRRGIALVPEGRRIFGRLSVGENIKIGATVRKDKKGVDGDIRKMLERFPVLRHYWNKSGAKLSGGEQQQLAIARALMSRPRMLLLDEPSLGLAPIFVDRIFELIQELRDEGVAVLLVEQNVHRALEIADRAYVLSVGSVVASGPTDQLVEGELERSYLGISQAG